MDLKKKSHALKARAKELGYEIKLTHAQEMCASLDGHKSRHSALKSIVESNPSNNKNESFGLKENHLCQSCRRRERKVARYFWSGNAQIWLLCEECVKPSSKFSLENGAKDVTDRYDLKAIYLRDIFFENESYRNKAFYFRLICSDGSEGDRYMFVPGLWSGHSEVKVWNMDKNQMDNGWWDWPIKILPYY
jgi:hypothetical protein